MRLIRAVRPEDETAIRQFECADPDLPFQVEVEEFLHSALVWLETPGVDREVLVLEEDSLIVGIVTFEGDEGDCFVNAIGIGRDRRGGGLGTEFLGSVLHMLAEEGRYAVATWKVHPANFASQAISGRLGAEGTWPPEDKPFTRYVVSLR